MVCSNDACGSGDGVPYWSGRGIEEGQCWSLGKDDDTPWGRITDSLRPSLATPRAWRTRTRHSVPQECGTAARDNLGEADDDRARGRPCEHASPLDIRFGEIHWRLFASDAAPRIGEHALGQRRRQSAGGAGEKDPFLSLGQVHVAAAPGEMFDRAEQRVCRT